MSGLRLSDDLTLPVDAVTETFALIANRGAGKSSSARVLVEELHRSGQPVIVLDVKGDWHGIRSNRTGKGAGLPFVILGGDHGDLDLQPGSGALIADTVVASRASAVLDLSALSKTKARTFAMEFAERLYRANRDPLHLVVDEADVLIPQRAAADTMRLLGAMEDLAKRGRSKGIGMTVITQRGADVSKSVLDLMETLIVLRVTGPKTRKAVMEWMDDHTDDDPQQMRSVLGSLKSLDVGEAWVYSPGWLGDITRIRFRRIDTLDTHATPKPGQARVVAQKTAPVDIAALGQQMAALVDEAKANDPVALRAEVARLRKELATATAAAAVEREVQVPVEVPVIPADLAAAVERLNRDATQWSEAVAAQIEAAFAPVLAALNANPPRVTIPTPPTRLPHRPLPPAAPRPVTAPAAAAVAAGDGVTLGKAHRAILSVLATYGTRPVASVAILTGYSAKGGGFRNALSALRTAGYVEGRGDLSITDAGIVAVGAVEPLPTGAALRQHWKAQPAIGKAHAAVLDVLAAAYPDRVTVADVAAAAGYEPGGGGFRNAVSRLRSLGLIEGRGDLRLSDELAE